jgi:hypothetical protein
LFAGFGSLGVSYSARAYFGFGVSATGSGSFFFSSTGFCSDFTSFFFSSFFGSAEAADGVFTETTESAALVYNSARLG